MSILGKRIIAGFDPEFQGRVAFDPGAHGPAAIYAERAGIVSSPTISEAFSPSMTRDLKNSQLSGALAYQLSMPNSKLVVVDMDFMGAANHIDVMAAERPKGQLFERIHSMFKGNATIYTNSAKLYIVINSPESLEQVKHKLAGGLNDAALYNYTDQQGRQQNTSRQLQRNPLQMLGVSVQESAQGIVLDRFLEDSKVAAKGAIKSGPVVVESTGPMQVSAMDRPLFDHQLNQRVIENIQQHQQSYQRALSLLTETLPENFRDILKGPDFTHLHPETKAMLFETSLDIWTRREFNTHVGQPNETLVYNRNAIMHMNDTHAPTERIQLSHRTVEMTADASTIGAKNNHWGWVATDDANYREVCALMKQKLLNMGIPKASVVVGVPGGDEFYFRVMGDDTFTPERRGQQELMIQAAYTDTLAEINSKPRTITRQAIMDSVKDPKQGEFLWKRVLAQASKPIPESVIRDYAHQQKISIDLARQQLNEVSITENSITRRTAALSAPYNKAYIDLTAIKGTSLHNILVQEGIVGANTTGVHELVVSFETLKPRNYKLLVDSGILEMRYGVNGSAAILPHNTAGVDNLSRLVQGDNASQLAKKAGLKCITSTQAATLSDSQATPKRIITSDPLTEKQIHKHQRLRRINELTDRRVGNSDATLAPEDNLRKQARRATNDLRQTTEPNTDQINRTTPRRAENINKPDIDTLKAQTSTEMAIDLKNTEVNTRVKEITTRAGTSIFFVTMLVPTVGEITLATRNYSDGKIDGKELSLVIAKELAILSGSAMAFHFGIKGATALVSKALAKMGVRTAAANVVPIAGTVAGIGLAIVDIPDYVAQFNSQWDPKERNTTLAQIASGNQSYDIRQQTGHSMSQAVIESLEFFNEHGLLDRKTYDGSSNLPDFLEAVGKVKEGDSSLLRDFKGGIWSKWLSLPDSQYVNRKFVFALQRFREFHGLSTQDPYTLTPQDAALIQMYRQMDDVPEF